MNIIYNNNNIIINNNKNNNIIINYTKSTVSCLRINSSLIINNIKDCAPNINKNVVSSLPHWILKCHYGDVDLYLVNYAFMYPSLSFIPTMSEFFRLCGNFSDYVGIFPTIWEFFQPCPISKEEFFPPCRNFSQFPSYMPGKIPSLLMEGLPGLSDAKKRCGWQ